MAPSEIQPGRLRPNRHLHDLRRAHEAHRHDRLAEPARNDQMSPVLFDMSVDMFGAVAQFGEDRPGERQIDLASVGVARQRQRDAPRHARKHERLMRQQNRRRVVDNLGQRAGKIVVPAPMAAVEPNGHLVAKPREAAREIAILAILVCHPGLLEKRVEEAAGIEFASPALAAFRDRLLALPAEAFAGAEALAAALAAAGLAESREHILSQAAGTANWWCVGPGAEVSDAEHVLRQTLALQRSSGALNRELKLAEQALAADPTEQNLARLRDIKANLADLANAEAAIEGFGSLSGRGSPPL